MNTNQDIDLKYGKIPPQAVEVEQAVLGALMLSDEYFQEAEGILKPEMFYKDEHQIIFAALTDMAKRGKQIDLVTVTQHLKDTGQLEKVGGPMEVTQLTRKVASAAHLAQHMQIIAQKYIQRQYIYLGNEIQKQAYENTDPAEIAELFNQFEAEFESMAAGTDTGADMQTALKDAIAEISRDNEIVQAGKMPGIQSGFKNLDNITGGWRAGNLIVSGARPGHGKTSLALYFARVAAKEGKKVLFFSLEMLKADLLKILIAAETEISRTALRDGRIHQQNWNTISDTLPEIENLPITWVDIPNISINRLTALAKYHHRRRGIDLLIVDYLQLIRSDGNPQYREQEVAAISRKLKALSLSLQIPIIVNSQLNRLAENERPKLSHLRESGSIEQDADIVLLPWRPGYSNFKDRNGMDIPENYGEIIVGKNRRGPRGVVKFSDLGEMLNFAET
jgi:replicative DNA helicase